MFDSNQIIFFKVPKNSNTTRSQVRRPLRNTVGNPWNFKGRMDGYLFLPKTHGSAENGVYLHYSFPFIL